MKSDPENLKCCYIGGGSKNWAWVFIKDLAFETEMAGTIHLYDTDIGAARTNEIIGNRVMDAHNRGRWRFVAEDSPQKALEGSDFVFISILPGDFGEMAVDVHTPERYGIYQSVGDTTGPGGINRALRTIPLYQKIAGMIKQWAPGAWVINYTNPMSVCVRTLYETFPGIKAFGCCHEVFGTQNLLGKVLEWAGKADKGEVKRDDIIINVLGVNHFTWIDQASWKSVDLFPLYRSFVDTFAETGYSADGGKSWLYDPFKCAHRVKMDLFRHFGVIAAAGDRHLAEFCPPAWYLKNPKTVRFWCFGLTPVSWRIYKREKLREKSAEYRNGTDELVPERSGEEGLRQMRALLGLGNLTTNVNLPNCGQMPGFPEGAVVETNAVFSRDRVRPVIAGRLPYPLEPLVLRHAENQEGIVRAAVERDLNKAFQVFLNDPAVSGLGREDARALFGEMTAATLPPDYADSLPLIPKDETSGETGISSRHEIMLGEIMELINKKYTEPMLSVAYMANHFCLSESYFSHLFKELSGEPLSSYLEKLRLAKARELLQNTKHGIEEISSRVGYFNSTSFRRAFKRIVGISPSEFRTAGGGGYDGKAVFSG